MLAARNNLRSSVLRQLWLHKGQVHGGAVHDTGRHRHRPRLRQLLLVDMQQV